MSRRKGRCAFDAQRKHREIACRRTDVPAMNYSGCLDPVGRLTDGFRSVQSSWCLAIFYSTFLSSPSFARDQIKIARICQLRRSRFCARLLGPFCAPCTAVVASSLLHSCAASSIDVDPSVRTGKDTLNPPSQV